MWFAKVSQRLRQCLSSQVIEHMVHFGESLLILDCLQFFHILQVEYSGNFDRKKVRGRNTGSFPEQRLEKKKKKVVWFVRLAKVSQLLRECLSSQIIEHTVHFGESLLILDYLQFFHIL